MSRSEPKPRRALPETEPVPSSRANDELFRLVVEYAPSAMVMVDREGKVVLVNSQAEKLFGYSRGELLGSSIDLLVPQRFRAKHPGQREGFFADPKARAMGVGRDLFGLRKNGTEVPVEIGLNPIRTEQGFFVLAAIVDITERVKAEEARQRNRELEGENRRILEANRLKSEFLANMSHELRTPLNSIIGFTELLHDGKVSGADEQKEYLGDVLASARHLLSLINGVLDLAKIESGKMEIRPQPVNLEVLVSEVVRSLQPLADSKNIRISVQQSKSVQQVNADPARFRQILNNYLSNALKFTPQDGKVHVRVKPEGSDEYRIEVEDSGIGIRAEDLERLFKQFEQLDPSSSKKYPGTGLGLYLTKSMVESHGGRIGVKSAPGKGSLFYAVLPREPRPAAR
jgi:PAS domain S-box-containing protein